MKVSIVTSILDSHEVVRRNILYYRKMNLPDDVEIIFVDDGSEPPLQMPDDALKNFTIVYTHNKEAWTEGIGRNMGAELAEGKYLLLIDIDHFPSRQAIDSLREFKGDRMAFKRYFGVLNEEGELVRDAVTLRSYGLADFWMPTEKKTWFGGHRNQFAINRELFWEMGGYNPKRRTNQRSSQDRHFKQVWHKFVNKGKARKIDWDNTPPIYMFPNGSYCGDKNYNPFGLFHSLPRK